MPREPVKNEAAITISVREMYDILLEVRNTNQKMYGEIMTRLTVIEEQLKVAQKTAEQSGQALDIAEEADRKADEAREIARRVEGQLFWLWRTIIGALITGAITALFYIYQK